MKACSPALRQHLDGEVTRLATLWRITRQDGAVLAFTDHDRDLVVDGVAYRAASGFTPSGIASSAGLAVDNLEIQSVLDSDDIREDELMAGLYDNAAVEIMLVNHADPGMGRLFARKGTLGEVRTTDHGFVAELRGMSEAFATTVGQLYTPTCRADLGDGRCRIDLSSRTVAGSVTALSSRRRFADGGRGEAAGWFTHGLLTWTGGANAGAAMDVKDFAGGWFELFLPMPRDIAVGDGYRVHWGCDRRFATCTAKFGNGVNFQGEPHVPGLDFLVAPAGR